MLSFSFRLPRFLKTTRISLMAMLLLFTAAPAAAAPYDLIIGTGGEGTFAHYFGKSLCRMIQKDMEQTGCSLYHPSDAIDTLTNVQGGLLDLALIDSSVLFEAVNNSGAFAYLDIDYNRLRIIAPLYNVPLTLLARKGITLDTPEQLLGKRINVGPSGTVGRRLFEMYLQSINQSRETFTVYNELPGAFAQDRLALKDGSVQILLHWGIHPDPSVEQLITQDGVTLQGVASKQLEGLLSQNPGVSAQMLDSTSYPALSEDLPTIGTTMVLVTSADAEDEMIEMIYRSLFNNLEDIQTLHPALADFQLIAAPLLYESIKLHNSVHKAMTKQ